MHTFLDAHFAHKISPKTSSSSWPQVLSWVRHSKELSPWENQSDRKQKAHPLANDNARNSGRKCCFPTSPALLTDHNHNHGKTAANRVTPIVVPCPGQKQPLPSHQSMSPCHPHLQSPALHHHSWTQIWTLSILGHLGHSRGKREIEGSGWLKQQVNWEHSNCCRAIACREPTVSTHSMLTWCIAGWQYSVLHVSLARLTFVQTATTSPRISNVEIECGVLDALNQRFGHTWGLFYLHRW